MKGYVMGIAYPNFNKKNIFEFQTKSLDKFICNSISIAMPCQLQSHCICMAMAFTNQLSMPLHGDCSVSVMTIQL